MGLPPIRKVYAATGDAGSTPDYWDHVWAGVDILAALQRNEESPDSIMTRLRAEIPSDGRVLEAGCGSGVVVAALQRDGHDVVGLDFAFNTLESAREQVPDLPLVCGNLATLPFCDASFGCVVSLGALEHFVEGPLAALREHRRVLREGGLFVLTLPRVSGLKQWTDRRILRGAGPGEARRSPRGRFVERVPAPTRHGPADLQFIQYEFPRSAVRRWLGETGFEIIRAESILNNAGIGESALVRRFARRRDKARVSGSATQGARDEAALAEPSSAAVAHGGPSVKAGPLRRIVLQEAGTGIVGRPLTRLSQAVLGHMDFVVARAVPRPTGQDQTRAAS